MLVFVGLFLAWLILPTKPEPVSTLPTDGLVEQVATVKQSLTVRDASVVKQSLTTEPIENLDELDHIGDATKMVEAKKEIVIFTRSNCPPCDRWKRIEQPKFERAGWTVAYCEQHNYGLTPTFLIDANGKQTEHRGYLAFDKINEVVK